jgi:hypothetical protein
MGIVVILRRRPVRRRECPRWQGRTASEWMVRRWCPLVLFGVGARGDAMALAGCRRMAGVHRPLSVVATPIVRFAVGDFGFRGPFSGSDVAPDGSWSVTLCR